MSTASAHDHDHSQGHGHSHGLVDESIRRSREGLRAVGLSLLVLGLTAVAQLLVYLLTDSVALLADLIHNAGDAATAIPLGVAFLLRSPRAERIAGLFVVLAIFVSACVAGYEAIARLIDPQDPTALGALALAGALGFAGNWILAVIASAAVVAIGLPIADPLIGLAITLVILRITWQSWRTIRSGNHAS